MVQNADRLEWGPGPPLSCGGHLEYNLPQHKGGTAIPEPKFQIQLPTLLKRHWVQGKREWRTETEMETDRQGEKKTERHKYEKVVGAVLWGKKYTSTQSLPYTREVPTRWKERHGEFQFTLVGSAKPITVEKQAYSQRPARKTTVGAGATEEELLSIGREHLCPEPQTPLFGLLFQFKFASSSNVNPWIEGSKSPFRHVRQHRKQTGGYLETTCGWWCGLPVSWGYPGNLHTMWLQQAQSLFVLIMSSLQCT